MFFNLLIKEVKELITLQLVISLLFTIFLFYFIGQMAKTEMKKARKFPTVSLDEIAAHDVRRNASSEDPPDPGLISNLREALNALHPRYRIPVVLKDMEGFSQEEIAQIMKKPVGTIKARISRGRSFLKKRLEKALAGEKYAV